MNIVLTGFMGTGKTSVGREVAARLGRPFVDMDVEIERRAGKPISLLFAQEGQAAFRHMEADLCLELSRQDGLVIATGGGALLDAANRRRMLAAGPLFCLTASPDEIVRRLAAAQDRPLLDVPDRRAEVERLLAKRQDAYRAMPRCLDTTNLSVSQITDRVIEQAFSILLPTHYPGGGYDIHIGEGVLERLGGLAAPFIAGEMAALVSNPKVSKWYGDAAIQSLQGVGRRAWLCLMPDGEAFKTLSTLADLYDQFLAGGLDRSGAVIALGGGVVCDVAGFAAATFMRGLSVIQVPTTLLAMVDASVGGKTAIDLPLGKNLVGAFKPPALVLIDPTVLRTLPSAEVAAGMAELIKHGVLADAELFAELADHVGEPPWSRWIARSLAVKTAVVEQDPFEQGVRAVLNLGHTVGHALEQLSHFTMRHGEAVSVGMVVAARIAVAVGLADATLPEQIALVLRRYHLPVRCPPQPAPAIWQAMGRDKKKQGRALRWILPRRIGQVEIVADVPEAVVQGVLCEMGAQGG